MNQEKWIVHNYCQCASCCVVRTAISHGTLRSLVPAHETTPQYRVPVTTWLPVRGALNFSDGTTVMLIAEQA